MSAEESTLQSKPIFTYTIPEIPGQPKSLSRGLLITPEVLTFFNRETKHCKNPTGGGPLKAYSDKGMELSNPAVESIITSPSFIENINTCYPSFKAPVSIPQASPCHTSELHASGVFSEQNSHQHLVSPVVLEPSILKCVLEAFETAQADTAERQKILNSPSVQYSLEVIQRCENQPKLITDIRRLFIPKSEIPKIVEAYEKFFTENETHIRKAHSAACPHMHFPMNQVQLSKYRAEQMEYLMQQVKYLLNHAQSAASNAFWNAAIFRFIENVLKECTTLELSQIEYIRNTVLRPSLLPPLFASKGGILFLAAIEGLNWLFRSSDDVNASMALRSLHSILLLGVSASVEVLATENPSVDVYPTTRFFAAATGSVVASIAATGAHVAVDIAFNLGKRFYTYFLPSTVVDTSSQPATSTPGLNPA
jgi:hypothetical protein